MSEKGILIEDLVGGDSIATRDAIELDANSNARVIQRVGFSVLHIPSPTGPPNRSEAVDADTQDYSTLSAEIFTNKIACGDKTKLIVMGEGLGTSGAGVALEVTPLWLDAEATPGYMGQGKKDTINFTSTGSTYINDGVHVRSRLLSFDLVGFPYVGIHISVLTLGSFTNMSIYAFVI